MIHQEVEEFIMTQKFTKFSAAEYATIYIKKQMKIE